LSNFFSYFFTLKIILFFCYTKLHKNFLYSRHTRSSKLFYFGYFYFYLKFFTFFA
jgi:hypothetical protein